MRLAIAASAAMLFAAASQGAGAQSEAEQKQLVELDRVCEAAREKRLAPMRAERIERCVKNGGRTQESCTEEFAHWGNTQKLATGARAGLFYDLPECIAADEARQKYRR